MGLGFEGVKQELTVEVLRREALRGHGRCRLQVSGTSMLPTLWPGDTVLIEGRPLCEVRVGDIVLYERCGRLVLHRLVALPAENCPGRLITRGDAMPQADPAVRVEGLLGVLTAVKRGGDWVGVGRTMGWRSRVAGAVLARSSGLVRVVLRVRAIPVSSYMPALSRKKRRDEDGAPGGSVGFVS